ncbi:hypothetical protein SAMN05660235_02134 [Sporolituus thermophilus DSM 23256]|uniref:Uncharacterized protein n=2 Tax=Sporolituus TaxID=909931 RepID=A0A1G7MFS9_9FIRM|nr:hypothetical protein SAMN05660235_02134 [Sporolituus thermophilus DSM 23256]
MCLGIAGTAKNTGKTTTTAAIISELRARDIAFYLTSIGYDGENLDNITGLPKPKLRVEQGDVVATAERCLAVSTATFHVLAKTAISTPLGRVIIAKVVKPGLIVTAGPNKSSEVRELRALLRRLGPGVIIFDGALSRIAPMAETDGFVLATGAAKTPNIPQLARETELIWRMANLPLVPRAAEIAARRYAVVTLLAPDLSEVRRWNRPSLLTGQDIDQVWEAMSGDGSYLYIPGILNVTALKALAARCETQRRRLALTFADPIKLMVTGDLGEYAAVLAKIEAAGIFAGVLRRVPLLAITVNPFYPDYRYETKTYEPAYVDFNRLQVAVQRHVAAPVFNIVKQGAKGLVDIIQVHARPWENPAAVHFD